MYHENKTKNTSWENGDHFSVKVKACASLKRIKASFLHLFKLLVWPQKATELANQQEKLLTEYN